MIVIKKWVKATGWIFKQNSDFACSIWDIFGAQKCKNTNIYRIKICLLDFSEILCFLQDNFESTHLLKFRVKNWQVSYLFQCFVFSIILYSTSLIAPLTLIGFKWVSVYLSSCHVMQVETVFVFLESNCNNGYGRSSLGILLGETFVYTHFLIQNCTKTNENFNLRF